ncbi:SPOR domain-containing protein [Lysobacter sp. 5GHs7-4]|uniref:SPOR domain-containing protein n=1 Tax=Lysobacter sp. 5GHs7-4 TaxID=2904253 RepID=UPI001E28D973|nr:SPOR domain-containing protein [Lysobacter sp. 5GHs7-4]UHQ22769.1 SPOR domain-containing protein [Lysobacter sp. 5GHs7-4]
MLVRASLVLLLMLNLGVTAWWGWRTPPPSPATESQPLGIARLQLLEERDAPPARVRAAAGAPTAALRDATVAAPAVATPAVTAPVPATPAPTVAVAEKPAPEPAVDTTAAAPTKGERCYSFGPFENASLAASARQYLQPLAQRLAVREQRTAPARGWRVLLPQQPSREQAQAVAQRIAAAGFNDYFVVADGAEANAIALGRYRTEDAARKRAQALNAAGFAAQAEPLGDVRATTWLDVAAGEGFDPDAAQAAIAVQRRSLDCAKWR